MATVLTTAGKNRIIDILDQTVASAHLGAYVGWGTGVGTAAAGDTDLFTAASEARVAGTESQPAADTHRVVATITSASGQTITNAGTFSSAGSGTPPSGGTLIVHGDFTGIVLASGDSIQFTIDLQLT